jgi:hypothetical protein
MIPRSVAKSPAMHAAASRALSALMASTSFMGRNNNPRLPAMCGRRRERIIEPAEPALVTNAMED